MSRKSLGKSFEKEVQRKDPSAFVPWANPNELQATHRITSTTQGPGTSGTRRMVSSARQRQDTSPGAEACCQPGPGRRHPVCIEEERPGAVLVPGIDDDGLTIEEGYDEQSTVSFNEDKSTIDVIARAVDTEAENRMRHELDQLRQMQIRQERDQLRQMLNNAPILTPVTVTKPDVENGGKTVHANRENLASTDEPKCGFKGRRWFVMTAVLLIVIAVAVTLALTLQPEQTPPPDPLSELLSTASSDGGVALADPSTPQNRAFVWLSGHPNLLNFTSNELIQLYALATLYYATKGDSWNNNDHWLTEKDVCRRWYSNDEDDMVVDCTSDGAVSMIALHHNNLQGVVPPEIGMLSDSLGALWLYDNELEGTLPTEIGELTKLTALALPNNTFSGVIPSVIGLLTNLEKLGLYNNSFMGNIPTEIGELTKLSSLGLYDNELEGTLPTEIAELTKLTFLALPNNTFSGVIPSVIGLLTNLEKLYLYNNFLTGNIPTEIGDLTKLITLSLFHNSLTGDVGPIIDALPQRLTSLELDSNNFTGTILPSIGEFTDLAFLDFGFCNLNGKIPTELGLLIKLTYLNLGQNQMTGTIPNELRLLTKLAWLNLSGNKLTGTVPTSLASLPLLRLFLDGNDFTGSLDAFCSINFDMFAANTCGQEEIDCQCCTYCRKNDGYYYPV